MDLDELKMLLDKLQECADIIARCKNPPWNMISTIQKSIQVVQAEIKAKLYYKWCEEVNEHHEVHRGI